MQPSLCICSPKIATATKMTNREALHDAPTEADRFEDLERQYANLQADPATSVIFCPWCSKGNRPDQGACCGFFAEGVAKIGQKKLDSVIKQLREVRLGSRKSIHCPYCGSYIRHAEHPVDWPRPLTSPFCCDIFSDAALAIAQRQAVEEQVEQKKRIEDGLARGMRN